MNNNAYRPFSGMPPVTLNLLIINILAYIVKIVLMSKYEYDISNILGLRFFLSNDFHWYQLFTYMFIHGNETHIFFNMFALFMFGPLLERLWGAKKFLFYYFVCGLGAALTQFVFFYYKIQPAMDELRQIHEQIMNVPNAAEQSRYLIDWMAKRNEIYDSSITIGASGAIYGLLAAYGVLFPNIYFYIYFFIPIKAKWFVILYGAIELFTGVFMEDNVAHFAHLGGMLFGIILVLIWRKKQRQYDYFV